MENNATQKDIKRTSSILSAIGILIMLVSLGVFLIIDRNKANRLSEKSSELATKDSLNDALADTLRLLRPAISPLAYAEPTNKMSRPRIGNIRREVPEFAYYLCLDIADSFQKQILSVDYFLDDPTFQNKHYKSSNSRDSFRVGYRGWGCLDMVMIYIEKRDNTRDTISFDMCNNLRLKGLIKAVN